MHVGIIHRCADRPVKHSVDYLVPRRRVTNQIRFQIVNELPASFGSGAAHQISGICKPVRAHDHCLSALPIDLANFDILVFKMVKQAPSQQR